MFCEKCGNELPDGVRYCNKCGTRVSPTQTNNEQTNGRPGKGGGVPAVAWVLLAVGIGVAAAAVGKYMILGRGGNQEDKGTTVVSEAQRPEPETSGSRKTAGTAGGKAAGAGEAGTAGGKTDIQAGQPGGSPAGESAASSSMGGSKETESRETEKGPESAGTSAARETPAAEVYIASEPAVESLPAGETDSRFILPGSDSRYIDVRELENFTAEQCRLARNEIYARHGRRFNDEGLQAYFDSRDWYTGTVAPENFRDDAMLNGYEKYNRDLIVKYEKEHGY